MKKPYNKMYFTYIFKFLSKIYRYFYIKDLKRNGMKIGKNFRLMSKVDFGSEPYLISIGEDVTISVGVLFSNHDGGAFVLRNLDEMKSNYINTLGEIKIGNNVFIGANSIILPNVSIGDNVVIGAGSIVSKSVESNCIAVGTPCKKIMSVEEYKNKFFEKGKVTKK
ncbi:acyltransferase [Arcobacter sp. YIC-310]|uniref:acyltransferase n=1 Tax=Arcobacter sp. YIC-310 TaxID=3376632 RepID=UPI003C224F79